ncbi:PIG-L family deacetylase [Actinophytocola sp. NPDC049390]|uniref:PIG-L family deacetylase n=1 Tax=Actinophytocola sp. NPDC049390 TaxID=3363894 RepID=UPI0037A11CE0
MATIVYVTPHQDDETLSMGASIRRHLESGLHDVHVLLLTTGSGSGAQAIVGLSDADFSAARDDELVRAVRALGVRADHIHYASNRIVGKSTLSVCEAQSAIAAFVAAHPGAWVKTYSNRPASGRHVDHVNAGQAAVNLLTDGTLGPNSLRLYVEPWALQAFRSAHPSVSVGTEAAAGSTAARVRRALDEYEDVDRPGYRYGIGGISVPSYFDLVRANPVSYYHVP